jgi:uncharacterized membrane protein YjgN (DUF898 family)
MALFWEAFRAAFLTIFTLGIYRFWMIARLRTRYWNGIRIDGDPLEYTGTGLEKVLGFLLALVVLALYLGAVNLALAFVGLTYAPGDIWAQTAVVNVSVLAVLPLVFYALYRSQRYMLARTRWRGIRFGLEPGAAGYAVRAVALSLLTLATLGLAYPYQHFRLAKYVTDRSWYGDLRFEQGGCWSALFAEWVWLYLAGGLGALLVWGMMRNPDDPMAAMLGGVVISLGVAAILLLYQRYRIAAFRILWSNRSLGGARFTNTVSAPLVLGTYMGGGIATALCAGLVALAALGVLLGAASGLGIAPSLQELAAAGGGASPLRQGAVLAVVAVPYLALFGAAFAFGQVFITRPVLAAQVEAMSLEGLEHLAGSRQRGQDRAPEAGGFADALGVDVGAGI